MLSFLPCLYALAHCSSCLVVKNRDSVNHPEAPRVHVLFLSPLACLHCIKVCRYFASQGGRYKARLFAVYCAC